MANARIIREQGGHQDQDGVNSWGQISDPAETRGDRKYAGGKCPLMITAMLHACVCRAYRRSFRISLLMPRWGRPVREVSSDEDRFGSQIDGDPVRVSDCAASSRLRMTRALGASVHCSLEALAICVGGRPRSVQAGNTAPTPAMTPPRAVKDRRIFRLSRFGGGGCGTRFTLRLLKESGCFVIFPDVVRIHFSNGVKTGFRLVICVP